MWNQELKLTAHNNLNLTQTNMMNLQLPRISLKLSSKMKSKMFLNSKFLKHKTLTLWFLKGIFQSTTECIKSTLNLVTDYEQPQRI